MGFAASFYFSQTDCGGFAKHKNVKRDIAWQIERR
jgi:hypothetical protein